MNNNYVIDFSITGDRVNLSLIKKMKKTTKSLEIRHHQQTIKRIEILINTKSIRKNVGAVLAALASFANKSGICFPSQETIANITGYKRETINRLVKKLSDLGYIKKTDNRKPLFVKDKVYFPRTIYKINIPLITKTLKCAFDAAKKLKMIADAKYKLKKSKADSKLKQAQNDHSATPKTDHTINSIKLLKINTTPKAAPVRKLSFLEKIFKGANEHENKHLDKLKLTAARRKGIKTWKINNGFIKSDSAIKKERKAGSIMKKARDIAKPLVTSFSELQAKLMQWNPTVNIKSFTKDDYLKLESLKVELKERKIPVPVNVIADYKLNEFISFNR